MSGYFHRKPGSFTHSLSEASYNMAHRTPATLVLAVLLGWPNPAPAQAPLAAQSCLGCHGAVGGPILALAGRPAAEIMAAMTAFRANQRAGTIMGRIARGFTDAEIAAVAADFSTQPPGSAAR